MDTREAILFHHRSASVDPDALVDHASKLRINLRSKDLIQTRTSRRGVIRKGSAHQYGNWTPLMTRVYGHMVSGHRGPAHQPSPAYIHNVVIPLHKSGDVASSYAPSLLSCSYSFSQSTGHGSRSRKGSALSCMAPSSQSHAVPDQFSSSTPRERSSAGSVMAARKASSRVSRQMLRYEAEQEDLTKCRTRKRSSEIRPHRVDHMYYMTGSSLKLEPRYKVEEDELQRLRELSRARKRTSYYGRGLRTEESYMDVGREPPKQPPPSSTGESETSPATDVDRHDTITTENDIKHEDLDSVSDTDLTAKNHENTGLQDAKELTDKVQNLSIQGNVVQQASAVSEANEQNEQSGARQEHNTQPDDGDSGVDNNSGKDSPGVGEGDPGR